MPTSKSGMITPELIGATFEVPQDLKDAGDSLNGLTVRNFPSLSALDAYFASLSSTEKPMTLGAVDGLGWFGWNGTKRVRIGGDLAVQAGFASGTTQPAGPFAGLLQVSYPEAFGGTTSYPVPAHAVSALGTPELSIRPYFASGYITQTQFHVECRQNGQSYANQFVQFFWIAVGARPNGA